MYTDRNGLIINVDVKFEDGQGGFWEYKEMRITWDELQELFSELQKLFEHIEKVKK